MEEVRLEWSGVTALSLVDFLWVHFCNINGHVQERSLVALAVFEIIRLRSVHLLLRSLENWAGLT